MDSQIPSSFIPKKPLNTPTNRKGGTAMGMFIFLISMLVFVASIVSAAGAFAYQGFLTSSLAQKTDTLQKAEAAFDPSAIQDLVRLDSRINNAEALMQKHISALAIFNFLAGQTLVNVQFTTFTYELQPDNSANITLGGLADGFSTVALQSDQLGASKVLKDVVFSGIVVDPTGKVAFNVKATIDSSLINYAKSLTAGAGPTFNADGSSNASTTQTQNGATSAVPGLQ
jgi:hypothetical protein